MMMMMTTWQQVSDLVIRLHEYLSAGLAKCLFTGHVLPLNVLVVNVFPLGHLLVDRQTEGELRAIEWLVPSSGTLNTHTLRDTEPQQSPAMSHFLYHLNLAHFSPLPIVTFHAT